MLNLSMANNGFSALSLRMRSIIRRLFNSGHTRTQKIKRNVAASFGIKGVSILLGLVKVPILIAYLNPEKYGVWLTIASIVMWVQHFDLGLGHGLRNKFAAALAKGDKERAGCLVSTAYFSMSILMGSIFVVLLPVVYYLDWNSILNVTTISGAELRWSVLLVLLMFNLRFVFHLITVILKADQRPALSDAFLPLASLLSLILIFVVKIFIEDSLFWASAVMTIPPVGVLVVGNIYFFSKEYKAFVPRVSLSDKRHLKDIYSLGIKFFFIQMIGLVMFSSSNVILANIVNPEEVTIFNVAKQYYGLPLIFFMIILTPYWSAVTDAYTRDEFSWIKSNMRKLHMVSALFVLGMMAMLAGSDLAFKIWIGGRVIIPYELSIWFVIYNSVVLFLSPYTFFLNGIGKLNLGLRVGVFKLIAFLPVAVLLVKHFDAVGLVMALILINSLPNVIFKRMQYGKIINKTATGIWNR
jgi:O-antigen/teichoic acid export membrane protein